jgi:hypothetical protein
MKATDKDAPGHGRRCRSGYADRPTPVPVPGPGHAERGTCPTGLPRCPSSYQLALGTQVPPSRPGVGGRLRHLHPVPGVRPATRKLLYTTDSIEPLNYQLRKVTKARGHFPGDDAVVKLVWLAIINIEDKRARERQRRRAQTGKRSDQPARLVEGQRVLCWREALNELDAEGVYAGRLRRG